MPPSRQRILAWLDQAADLGLLLIAWVACNLALPAAFVPWPGGIVLLVLGALALRHGDGRPGRGFRAVAARLPAVALVTLVAAALVTFWFHLPWAALAFAPAWVALELLHRVVLLDLLPRMGRWLAGRPAPEGPSRIRRFADALYRRDAWLGHLALLGAILYLAGSFYPGFWTWPARRAHAVVLGWGILFLAAYRGALRLARLRPGGRAENYRWIFVGIAALFLLRGFARFTANGTGDAVWYGMMLADAIAQVRAGVFPVWVGQSIYQFNGAIYPLRVAPAFHYLGALLDALSGRSLGVFAVQNLLLTVIGLAGIFSAYFSLAALLPGRRWLGAGLAVLFLACPGVLGVAYNTDLYMTWTTLPWVPLVLFATVRSFRDGGALGTMLLLGAALGICWWGHSPIALWMTVVAGAAQALRVLRRRPDVRGWQRAAAGALACAAVAAYPVGSVLMIPAEIGTGSYDFQRASPGNIVYFVQQAFPGTFLPLSRWGRDLGDFQLGYALWFLLLLALWRWRRIRSPEGRFLLAAAVALVALLTPVPRLNLALWSAVPGFIRDPTSNWAMNRLYLVLAGAVVYAVAAAAGEWRAGPWPRRILGGLVALGCVWSGAEAVKFADGARDLARPPASAVDLLRPENVVLTRYSYFVFPRPPDYFNHGVVDPGLENRLWRDGGAEPFLDDLNAARALASPVARATFDRVRRPANDVDTAPRLFLDPRLRYLLAFDFEDPKLSDGTIQLVGDSLFRVYALPDYGGTLSFGVGDRHPDLVPLWTTVPSGEAFTAQFYADPSLGPTYRLPPFGAVTLLSYDPARLPIQVFSWIPYRAHVASPAAAWLETPRMFQTGYQAQVNGRPTEMRRSPEGLVEVRVPAGRCDVKVAYYAPAGLQALFWFSAAAILALGGMAAVAGFRAIKTIRQTASPKP